MLAVKVIEQAGEAAVVEAVQRDGSLARKIVPLAVVRDSAVTVEDWEMGADYGESWETHIPKTVSAETIANALHRYGIWTIGDWRARPAVVRSALLECLIAPIMVAMSALRED